MADRISFGQQDEDERTAEVSERQAAALYLADMTRQLEELARGSKLELLAYLIGMARVEAESISLEDLKRTDIFQNSSGSETVVGVAEHASNLMNPKSSLAIEASAIILFVTKWAGGRDEALRWYRSQPIAAFGDRTAEALVKSGQAEAVRDYLDSIALGGYA